MIFDAVILLAVIGVGVAVVRAHRSHVSILTTLHAEISAVRADIEKVAK